MPDDRYRFTVGDFECLAIKDSETMLDGKQLFSNIEKDVYKSHLKARGEKAKKITLHTNALAVFSDDWLLIDAGYGSLTDTKGNLAKILDDEEIRPEHIMLTHLHPDHFGGLIDEDGDDTFGNVPVYVCQGEWMMAQSSEFAELKPAVYEMIKETLRPAERQFEPIECLNMNEILPGFSVIRLPGHTPNHIGILIESNGEKLLYAGDSLIHPLHLEHLDWRVVFDEEPEQARDSRVRLAELALELDAMVMLSHFAFPGIGRIERVGDGYRWVAVD